MVFDQIYDTLLAFDDDGTVVPNLAQEWSVSNVGGRSGLLSAGPLDHHISWTGDRVDGFGV